MIHIVVIAVIIGFIVVIGFAVQRMEAKKSHIRDNCAPTELYVIGNKGHVTRVYDCSNLEHDGETNVKATFIQ